MSKSTLQTAIAIANSSIGSAMIIFPLNYLKYGIIQNFIFLILMGFVLAATCSVYGMHLRPSQKEITMTVRRVLGVEYFRTGAFLSGVLVTLVSSLFFLLASDIFFDVCTDIFGQLFLSQKLFKLFLMLIFAGLTFLNDLKYVFKFSPIAMGALLLSTFVLILSFPFNLSNIDSGIITPKPFSISNLMLVASINGFAFTCHPSISPMLKQNKSPKQNKKAIYLGFIIALVLYFIVGVCGSMAIYAKKPAKDSNVMDYFVGQWQAPLIGFANFIYFLMIFPIFPYVGKDQLVSLLPEQIKQKPKFQLVKNTIFVIVWLAINTLFILQDSSPGVIMGFLGSVVAFYFTYFLPIMILFKGGKTTYLQTTTNQKGSSVISEQQSLIQSTDVSDSKDICSNLPLDRQIYQDQVQGKKYIIKHSPLKANQKIVFGAILALGVLLFIVQIVGLFVDI